MIQITLTRQALYNLVWSTPLTTLAEQYAISDVGLGKRCVKMHIPLPKAGHWAKVHAGQRVKMTPLSTNDTCPQEIRLTPRELGDYWPKSAPTPLNTLIKAIENDPRLSLTVPDQLTDPDELIDIAGKSLTKNQNHHWPNVLAHTSSHQITIKVAPQNIARALRFMDTFIKAIRSRGHDIKLGYQQTYVVIEGEEIAINFRERLKKITVEEKWTSTEFIPTGVLSLNAKASIQTMAWKDGRLPLEKQLSTIMAKLELWGQALKAKRLEWEKRAAEQAEKERIALARKQRKEKELSDFKLLLQQAHRWRETTILREYIAAVANQADTHNAPKDLQAWLAWARQKADWYDPLVEREDELLADIDRDRIPETEDGRTGSSYYASSIKASKPWHPNRRPYWD